MTWSDHLRDKPGRTPAFIVGVLALLVILLIAVRWLGGATFPISSGGVQWSDYGGPIQSRIDTAKANRDCATLQAEFDNANGGNADMMARTGHNNTRLLEYIDSAMRSAGCR